MQCKFESSLQTHVQEDITHSSMATRMAQARHSTPSKRTSKVAMLFSIRKLKVRWLTFFNHLAECSSLSSSGQHGRRDRNSSHVSVRVRKDTCTAQPTTLLRTESTMATSGSAMVCWMHHTHYWERLEGRYSVCRLRWFEKPSTR